MPHSLSPAQVQDFTPPLLSVLDYNSLFMLFSFVEGGVGSICPGAVLDYVPGGGVEEWFVVHLLTCCWVCRFTQAALKTPGWEKCHAAFLKADTSWDCIQHSGA
jgi:hypothetical protein